MILALAGNPNCGKTTLFNALTGANARTGNFPGVTVTRSEAVCRARPDVTLVDLPGVYALRPFSDEERVTRAYLLGGEPDAVISIADATCPARSLYLTLQLLELGVPVVLALNVMDALRAGGGAVDTVGLAQALGIPVVPVSAALGEGLDTLLDAAVRAAKGAPPDPWRALAPGAVQSCVRTLAGVLADEARRAGLPPVLAATQWLDGESDLYAPEAARQAAARMERETGLTRSEALPTARFAQVDRLTRFFTLPQTLPGHRRSARIDRVLTGRYTAYPAMAALLGGVCCLTFHIIGPCLSRLLAHAIAWLADAADGALLALDARPLLRALVREGVFAGVGSVAAFAPVILALFFFLSLLEDTGYLARVAFVMDSPLRRLGLSGQSAVPLLLGFGCSVPAVLAARTLPAQRSRTLTILLTPWMSCSAKTPVYAAFAAAFFPQRSALVFLALYALGIGTAVGAAKLLVCTGQQRTAVPFVMELPDYRWPDARSVLRQMQQRTQEFLARAFTVILAASIGVWGLRTFTPAWRVAACADESLLAAAGQAIAPVFAPLGFGDWRAATALVTGLLAKETVLSTLGVLLGGELTAALPQVFSPAAAASFLVFTALYAPCVAAQAAMRQELGSRLAALAAAAGYCAAAWCAAALVYRIAVHI